MQKVVLLGKNLEELRAIATELGLPAFAGKQLSEWLYTRKKRNFAEMTNLSVKGRDRLQQSYETGLYPYEKRIVSADGTVKYLFKVGDNRAIETVFIPEQDRATLCISCQIGCQMNCAFCATGKQGFAGQLSVDEILNQVESIEETDQLTNIVFMGMGEPLNNCQQVLKAIEVMTAPWGYGWSPKRITLSTVGILPALPSFLNGCNCHLAVSLHAPSTQLRQSLVPAEKAYPIADVLHLLKQYDFSHQRRLSFEYTLFAGVNDQIEHAKQLAALLKGLDCRVNLIPFHAVPGVALTPSSADQIALFEQELNKLHLTATTRRSRGQDIEAACGLLSTKHQQQ